MEKHMIREVKLHRTDNRPLAFYGTEIAYATDKQRDSTRWTNVRLFKANQGGYVVGIARLSCFIGERDHLTAEPVKTIKEAIALIQRTVPELADMIAIQLDGRTAWKRSHKNYVTDREAA
jgi:hypothetical protein